MQPSEGAAAGSGEGASPAPASIALIFGAMPHAPPGFDAAILTLAVQNSSQAAPAVYSRTDVRLRVETPAGGPPTVEPGFLTPPKFSVAAEDGSLVWRTEGPSCQLHARVHGVELSAVCTGPPRAWSSDGYGPEGGWGRWKEHGGACMSGGHGGCR